MKDQYSLFLSLSGEIVIKNNDSLLIYIVDQYGISQAFANDKEMFEMILFPIERVPKGKTWERHRLITRKLLLEK
jgi:hypothetical protein